MELFIIFTAFTALGVAANLWGADTIDSRDRFDPWWSSNHHV